MPEKKEFKITRTVTYETTHYAYSRETIEELIEMGAPLMWRETDRTHVIHALARERGKNEN